MGGLDFDEQVARQAEALYERSALARRRAAVRDALALKPGERVLCVGPGPGHEPAEMAEAVGPEGAIVGVDTSQAMLAVARERCRAFDQVDLRQGDATDLPVDDGSFDAAVVVQVLEYVEDLDTALAELHRALRPGGRAVVVDSDWSTLRYNAADTERNRRVLEAFEHGHCPHPTIARTLRPRLEDAGFEVTGWQEIVQFDPVYDEDTFGYAAIELIAKNVPGWEGITEAEAQAWMTDIHETGEQGAFFFSLNQYLFVAERPQA